jgi:alpha/beta superfamily hydrolase
VPDAHTAAGEPGRFTIRVGTGIELEARWDVPAEPGAAVVFCHPDPRQRGTMTVPLMAKVAEAVVARGLAVLRFNFRGVGRSTGTISGGTAEIDDVAAAVETAASAFPSLPLGLAGWSFGAVTSLHWAAREASAFPWVGIAPPVHRGGVARLPSPERLRRAERTFIVGDRDQFVTVAELEDYAAAVGGRVHVLGGSDHFFVFREERVAELAASALCEACLKER